MIKCDLAKRRKEGPCCSLSPQLPSYPQMVPMSRVAPLTQSPGARLALSLLSCSLYPWLLTLLASLIRDLHGLVEVPEVSQTSQCNTNVGALAWRQAGWVLELNFLCK